MKLRIGEYNDLVVSRDSEFGLYLSAGDEEVLLPNKYVPACVSVGDSVRVFVYTDSEDRPVATTREPHAVVGDVVPLEVVDAGERGAFLDWGLEKDLFVPHREQSTRLRVSDVAVVLVTLDERSGRVIGTARLEQHLSRAPEGFAPGQGVRALVAQVTPLGYTVALDSESLGFVYEDQTPEPLRVGDSVPGWVQRIREDGRVDVALRAPSRLARKDDAAMILDRLREAGGTLPFHDASDPGEIEADFGISKKAFKRAVAALYRERKIVLRTEGIRLAGAGAEKRRGGSRGGQVARRPARRP